MASRNLTEQVKVGLAAGAILATFVAYIFARLRQRARENAGAREFLERTPIIQLGRLRLNAVQTLWAALLLLTLFGTLNYNRYNTRLLVSGYDEYDLLHYYVNPKYFDELGYFRLLPALIIADHESGAMCPDGTPYYLAQDEHDYQKQPIRHALARTEEIKSHFTAKRWDRFVHDATYLQRHSGRLKCKQWRQLLRDHGYNGTPVWTLVARPIVSIVPVEWIKAVTSLDLVVLIAMLAVILWAFGAEAFLFCWLFITISYSFRWPTISWAMLRYDWVVSMVVGICMIKKRKHYAAGAFFGYAALMRYFPALWLFGILAKGIHAVLTRRDVPLSRIWLRVPTRYYKMAAGFFGIIVLLVGLSAAVDGLDAHKASLENMAAHVEPHNLSSMRQGLSIALTYRGETDQLLIGRAKKELVAQIETPVRIAAVLMILVLGLFMSRLKDWEAVGLGLIPYFWLTTSSYYYYSMRLTAVLIHAADLSKRRNVVGLSILFAIELFCNASEHINKGNRYLLISVMGLMLLAYSVVMMAFLGYEWWTTRNNAPVDETDAAGSEG